MDQTMDGAAREPGYDGHVAETAQTGVTAEPERAHEDRPEHSKRAVFWVLAGLVMFGAAVIYRWWREPPR